MTFYLDNGRDYFGRIIEQTYLDAVREGTLLDVGCGDGELCRRLSPSIWRVGLDVVRSASWKRCTRVDFVIGDALHLPFRAGCFDTVFEKDFLHHVSQRSAALSEFKRVAKGNAMVIVVEANRYNPLLFLPMTLLLGHDHLTQKEFSDLLSGLFSSFSMRSIEAYCWPTRHPSLYKTLRLFERAMERLSFLRPYLSYNIAIMDERTHRGSIDLIKGQGEFTSYDSYGSNDLGSHRRMRC